MKITEIDALTNIKTEREATENEIAEIAAAMAEVKGKENAAITAKAALLERLGITEDEAKLLLS
jgi:hypothetical protein